MLYSKKSLLVSLLSLISLSLLHGQTDEWFTAIAANQLDAIQSMIDAGVDVTQVDEAGNGAIHIAVKNGSIESVKRLLAANNRSLIEQRDAQNNTPLLLACEGGDPELVSFLIQQGAWARTHNLAGESAYSIAEAHENAEALQVVEDALEWTPDSPAELVQFDEELAAGWKRNYLLAEHYRESAEKILRGRSSFSEEVTNDEIADARQFQGYVVICNAFNDILTSSAALCLGTEVLAGEPTQTILDQLRRGQKYLDGEYCNSVYSVVDDIKWEFEKAGLEF